MMNPRANEVYGLALWLCNCIIFLSTDHEDGRSRPEAKHLCSCIFERRPTWRSR